MTKNQKIKAYRKVAELINTRKQKQVTKAMYKQNIYTLEVLGMFSLINKDEIFSYISEIINNKGLKETILLSCAELVRLDFEIE